MKMNIKLFSAALAVAALASCSNDEFSSSNAVKDVKATLEVNVEELQEDAAASTRSAYYYKSASEKNALFFQDGDEINVYDDALTKYDVFALADGKFTTSTTNVAAHKFAAHPANAWRAEGWTADGVRAAVLIPKTGYEAEAGSKTNVASYTLKAEDQISGQNAYTAIVPMWGAAEDDATTNIKTDLKFLTGVLKVTLNGYTKNDVKFIRVVSDKEKDPAISGYFEATLKDGAELKASTTNAAYQEYYGHQIVVAVPQATQATDYIAYIPIISGVSFKSLKVQYATCDEEEDLENIAENAWIDIYEFTDKTFERGKAYSSMLSVTFVSEASMNTQDVTNALEVNKDGAADLNINTSLLNVVYDDTNADKHTIYLPNSSKNITLNFQDFDVSGPGTDRVLYIKEKDGATYTGTLTFKNNTQDDVNLNISAPNAAKVVLDGTYNTAENTYAIETANLVIGDGNVAGNTQLLGSNKLTLKLTGSIEIANDAATTGTLDLTGATAQVPLTIGGSAADVKTVKDVTVSTVGEDIAITGTLYFETSAKLTLKQGLINAIDVKQGTANVVTLVNPEGQGIAAIKSVNVNETATFKTEGISKWNGELISDANKAGYTMGADGSIYTASQFATWASGAATLKADIDLNNIDPLHKSLYNATFDGGNHTIYNVGNAKTTESLFSLVTGTEASALKKLTVDGITLTAVGLSGKGALVELDNAVSSTYENITLKNVALGNVTKIGADYAQSIGGLIGNIKKTDESSTTAIKSCSVSGAITGYAYLGGFIGKVAKGVVSFKKCTSDVAFTFGKTYGTKAQESATNISYDSKKVDNKAYLKDTFSGTIGSFVGGISDVAGAVSMNSTCVESKALDKKALMFDNNWKTEATADAGVSIDQYFHGVTSYVGYSVDFKTISFFNAQGVEQSYNGTEATQKKAFNLYSQEKN